MVVKGTAAAWAGKREPTSGAVVGGGEDEEGARGFLVRQAARLLAKGHGADVELLDLVDAADGHGALLGQRQAVREAAAVEARHEVHLRATDSCCLELPYTLPSQSTPANTIGLPTPGRQSWMFLTCMGPRRGILLNNNEDKSLSIILAMKLISTHAAQYQESAPRSH